MKKHSLNVRLKSQNTHYDCASTDSLLMGGLRHGLAIHYECSNGSCGVCKAKLVSGQIKRIRHRDFSLTKNELDNDTFLMCCNAPKTDVEIEIDLIGDVKSIEIQQIETKIKSINFLNDEIAIVNLRTPRSKTLQFMAGQEVELSFQNCVARYPIASCPCRGMELEFHIRNNPADALSRAIFSKKIKSRTKIALTGPTGIFVLKEHSKRPMVFIAWDEGFAPIRSLVEHAFLLEMPNPIHFYWAYPAQNSAPYLDSHAQIWQEISDDYAYHKIACTLDKNHTQDGKTGCKKIATTIFDALDLALIRQADVYLSAPAEVLIYLGELLLQHGLNESQLSASPI